MPERTEWKVRRARASDLPAIVALEQAAFQPWRQSSRASLRRSLESPRQSVWVAEQVASGHPLQASGPDGAAGGEEGMVPAAACLVLWHHPHALRVYGVAVRPDLQGQGLGRELMRHAERLAQKEGKRRIILEADAADRALLTWYGGQGYERVAELVDFYAPGRHAWRLEKRVS